MALLEEQELQGNWLFRYRGYLPILVLIVGISLFLYKEAHPENWIIEGSTYHQVFESACLMVSLLGLFFRVITIGYAADNTSGRNTGGQLAETLNTTGIYSIMRHPLYVGNFFMWLGIALLTGNAWFIISFILLFSLYYERIMFAEEQFLRRKFGNLFTAWAEKTPAVIPNFNLYKPPYQQFNWKKVLRNEKTGFALLFLTFFVFDLAGEWIKRSGDINFFLLAGCLMSLSLYLVLKILQKRHLI